MFTRLIYKMKYKNLKTAFVYTIAKTASDLFIFLFKIATNTCFLNVNLNIFVFSYLFVTFVTFVSISISSVICDFFGFSLFD